MSRLKQLAADLMQQEQPQQPQGSWGDLTTYPYGENSRSTSNLAEILAGTEVERGMFAPLVEYGDGRIEPGVPKAASFVGNALMASPGAIYQVATDTIPNMVASIPGAIYETATGTIPRMLTPGYDYGNTQQAAQTY